MSRMGAICAGVLMLLSGCAVTTIREDGSREVFGFVNMRLDPSGTADAYAGDTIDLTTFGILIFTSPLGGGVALGYAHEQATALKNHALIFGAPGGFPGSTHETLPAVQAQHEESRQEGLR